MKAGDALCWILVSEDSLFYYCGPGRAMRPVAKLTLIGLTFFATKKEAEQETKKYHYKLKPLALRLAG